MKTRLTLKAVLEKAVQREIESQRLYRQLDKRVKEQAAKDAFSNLVVQEKGHQHFLEEYLRGKIKEGVLAGLQPVDYKIAEKLEQPEVSPDMKLKDVFLLAANREKLSHELYLGLANMHPRGRVRLLFEDLAAQELQHKQIVESLFTEVAFPQTDGG